RHLSSEWEATRIEALHWISTLLIRYRVEVLSFLSDIFETLLKALSDTSEEVVLLVLEVHACIAQDAGNFHKLVLYLIQYFRADNSLLEKRCALIIRRLCVLLDAETVYRKLSSILVEESDLDFASIMVQALNLILLTSSELGNLRDRLKKSHFNDSGKDLFTSLHAAWCHSPMAIISLCLLSQNYEHASSVIQSLGEEDINVLFLVQLDKLVHLLESPTFAYLRLQLLEPAKFPWLLKALYGLLMLFPQQSMAFKILRTRLKTVPPSSSFSSSGKRSSPLPGNEDGVVAVLGSENSRSNGQQHGGEAMYFASRLQQFEKVQEQHRA
ncbi:hypothetical protein M569_15914, partial [Genlisea aurea]